MKMALDFNRGDLHLQTYRITRVSSQLVLNLLPHSHSYSNLFHIPLILYRCGTSHVYI